MTRDDALRLAMDAMLLDRHDCSDDYFIRGDAHIEEIVGFAGLVAAAEREECAKMCENISIAAGFWWEAGEGVMDFDRMMGARECAKAIRNRK